MDAIMVTVPEAAKLLGLTLQRTRREIRRGRIPVVAFGHRTYRVPVHLLIERTAALAQYGTSRSQSTGFGGIAAPGGPEAA